MPSNQQNNPNFFNFGNVFTSLNSQSYDSQVKTIGTTQATPSKISSTWDDASPLPATPTSTPGVGAGTTNDATTSVGADNNPGVSGSTTAQQLITATFGTSTNSRIITQPNVLDQYASYTYSISWYLLTPAQYNNLYTTQRPNTAGWQLLMQSGGAPTGTRSQFFPVDYYMDDLEIESVTPGHGTMMANTATDIKFKVVEPNGITLIEQLYKAVQFAYKTTTPSPGTTNATTTATTGNASQTSQTPNYLAAQHCLIIEFYGYDSQGNLIAPATGQLSVSGQLSNTNPKAVITKYYPCIITDIKFRVANRQIEYNISAKPLPHFYNAGTDRGTIPFAFSLSGQTVAQLLQGSPVSAADIAQFDPGARESTPAPAAASIPPAPAAAVVPPTLSTIVTGQDNPQATSGGMDFSQLSG